LRTIAEIIKRINDLEGFDHLVRTSGVVDLLSRPHPFTVFAPKGEILSDFSDIEKAYLLSKEGREDLGSIIERHIHDGAIYSRELLKEKRSLTSIQGEKIKLDIQDKDELYADGNLVSAKDLIAANGKCLYVVLCMSN
jgi:uncharacterized surface protein with fasciclin (FAS1) repeats